MVIASFMTPLPGLNTSSLHFLILPRSCVGVLLRSLRDALFRQIAFLPLEGVVVVPAAYLSENVNDL